jgi:hypothetical protein
MEYTLDLPDTLITKFAHMGYDDPLEGLQDAAKLLLGFGPEAWGTMTAGAKAAGVTPAKFVLAQMESRKDAEPPLTKATARKPLRPNNAERDAQIWEMARTGSTHAKIAATYGLSVIRVSQIVALQRARSLSLDAPQKA